MKRTRAFASHLILYKERKGEKPTKVYQLERGLRINIKILADITTATEYIAQNTLV